jgi:endonuclease I
MHFIPPTDGKVNGIRSSFPHGNSNGINNNFKRSKLGTSAVSGYTGTVFAPAFKGDIARMYFLFCYTL